MNVEERFLYVINPRIPIRNLVPGKRVNRETVLQLNLEEVKLCLKHGPVYRKFTGTTDMIRVTLENCERLHQRSYVETIDVESNFIPKKETKKEKVKVEPVIEVPVEEEVVETPIEVVEPVVEEVSEEVVEEEIPIVSPKEEIVEEVSTEEIIEEEPVAKKSNSKNRRKK